MHAGKSFRSFPGQAVQNCGHATFVAIRVNGIIKPVMYKLKLKTCATMLAAACHAAIVLSQVPHSSRSSMSGKTKTKTRRKAPQREVPTGTRDHRGSPRSAAV